MKKQWMTRGVGAVLVMLAGSHAWAGEEPRQITVYGDADVLVVPDQAVVRFVVNLKRSGLEDARRTADRKATELLGAMGKQGVAPKDTKTDFLYIWAEWDWQNESRGITGYHVRKEVEVTVKDIKNLESILAAGLTSGANEFNGVEFRVSELRKYRDQARLLALKAAREKAEAMAGALGQKVGRPLAIAEQQTQNADSWWWGWWGGGRGGQYAQNVVQNTGGGDSGSGGGAMALGQKRVNCKVTVSFELL